MPKQVIVNMEGLYPFGECEECDSSSTKVLVRKKLVHNQYNKNALLQKAQYFRRLNQNVIIKLQSILEEDDSIHLLYEYVPIKMQTWLSNINERFIQNFCKQLIEFGEYLAKCYIVVDLKLSSIGMDQNYKAKYFLDLNFDIREGTNKNELKSFYSEQIVNFFKPYFQSKTQIKNHGIVSLYKPQSPRRNSLGDKNDSNDITSSVRLKEKAIALHKQRKNESINVQSNYQLMYPNERNRKQSILSSISNVKINKLGKRIDEIKSQLKSMYSPEPIYVRHEQKSIEKGKNTLAFNFGSTERIYNASMSPRADQFCNTVFKNFQEEQSMFSKMEKNFNRQIMKPTPMKKNTSLKEKEYEQMIKSDDGYFKDFFQVLEDKPPEPEYHHHNQHKNYPALKYKQESSPKYKDTEAKQGESHFHQLQNRVKSAINKSKNLINRFKTTQIK